MIQEAIAQTASGRDLSEGEIISAMEEIMQGEATPAQIGGLLVALRIKGETVEEIAGAASVMRRRCTPVPLDGCPGPVLDTCGTGGDGAGTFNVSTVSALVAAGAGARVAKHGNRSVSSQCGSADLMEALGVSLDLTPEQMGLCIQRVGIGFLFAQRLHPAMRHAAGPRGELKMRTIFNVLGPLTNPAGADSQLLGVFHADLVEPLAHVLGKLGCRSALVVHGHGGLDEISLSGPTTMARLLDGRVAMASVSPEDAGLKRAEPGQVLGGDADENAALTRSILGGAAGPCRDMVLLNAGAALMAAGLAGNLGHGVDMAAASIDQGKAAAKLEELIRLTQDLAAGRQQ